MDDRRTHRGLSTYMVECGRRVELALFYENSEILAADRMSAIRRRALYLAPGVRKPYPIPEQDAHRREAKQDDSVCPVHGYEPALECSTCHERGGDFDYWTPESEFA